MTRITDYISLQSKLQTIRTQKTQQSELERQMSTSSKASSFSEMSSRAGKMTSVNALKTRTSQYLEDMDVLDARLNTIDNSLTSIRKLATDFRTTLVNAGSATTSPNVQDVAKSYLDSLTSYLNVKDGETYLFGGTRQTTKPVASGYTAPPTSTTLSLSGALPSAAPINTQNTDNPTPGSYVDVSIPSSVYDSSGTEYQLSLRYVKTAASTWEARITSLTRVSDGANVITNNGAISKTNSALIGAFDPTSPATSIGALTFSEAAGQMPPGANTGATLTIDLRGQINGAPLTSGTGAANGVTSSVNASPSQVVAISGNFPTTGSVGSSSSITLSGANALYDSNGNAYNATFKVTKLSDAGNPSLDARNLALAVLGDVAVTVQKAGGGLPSTVNAAYAWADPFFTAAGALDMTAVDATYPPGGQVLTEPLYKVELTALTEASSGSAVGTTPAVIGAWSLPSGGFGTISAIATAGAGTLGPITVRPGAIDTTTTAMGITGASNKPPSTGNQLIEVKGNFSSAAPINKSIASPTPGSYVDVTFKDTEALVDSQGNRHNASLRFIKTSATEWQAYLVGLNDAQTALGSSSQSFSETQPLALGVPFDPAAGTTLYVNAPLKNGATLNVALPMPAGTIASAPVAQTNTITFSGAPVVGDATTVTVNGTKFSYTATGADTATTIATNLAALINASTAVNEKVTASAAAGVLTVTANVTAGPPSVNQTGVPFTLGFDVDNTTSSTLQAAGALTQANVPGAAVAQVDQLTIGAPANNTIYSVTVAGYTVAYTSDATATATEIEAGLLQALRADANISAKVAATGTGAGGPITLTSRAAGSAFVTGVSGGALAKTTTVSNRETQSTLLRPENVTYNPSRTPTEFINLSGNLSTGSSDNAFSEVRLSGQNALVAADGTVYNATLRFERVSSMNSGGTTPQDRYQISIVSLTNATTGVDSGLVYPIQFGSEVDPTTPQTVAASDAASRTFLLQAPTQTVAGSTLTLKIPVNSNSFSGTNGPLRIVPAGEVDNILDPADGFGTSLSGNATQSAYFNTPGMSGNTIYPSQVTPLTARIADDYVMTYGVRADNEAFEKFRRVLSFFADKSVPPSQTELSNAQSLLDDVLGRVDVLRADVSFDQIQVDDQRTSAKTTVNTIEKDLDNLNYMDPTEAGAKLSSLNTMIQASYATLAAINKLSLVNYL